MLIEIDGRKVKMLREEHLITPAELAAKAGVNRSTIYNIESGRHSRAQLATLRGIAEVFDLDPRELRRAQLRECG